MTKIRNLMRRATIISVVTGAVILGATATAQASEPAGPAPAAVSSSTGTSDAGQDESALTNRGAGECTHYLEIYGYTVTNTRRLICSAAAFPIGAVTTRIATCTAALIATGVGTVVSPIACTLATGP
ncbi:hypothetical protein [Jidongwangia harbinensis]|uniref:hypothetical protein n=1 Tax=Jidongwangia harbinensis TaxID=2878561 RepID=UPI001CDA3DD4|nr:hypothetical protein [Jidongwangia harbinensis]MCA2212812.1 hypothetical protein [Jidongwangia harbinensis]